jgi:hypothetical protein
MNARELTVKISTDTTAFDKAMRRVRRQTTFARLRMQFWLALYAAAVTGAAIALAVVVIVR